MSVTGGAPCWRWLQEGEQERPAKHSVRVLSGGQGRIGLKIKFRMSITLQRLPCGH